MAAGGVSQLAGQLDGSHGTSTCSINSRPASAQRPPDTVRTLLTQLEIVVAVTGRIRVSGYTDHTTAVLANGCAIFSASVVARLDFSTVGIEEHLAKTNMRDFFRQCLVRQRTPKLILFIRPPVMRITRGFSVVKFGCRQAMSQYPP